MMRALERIALLLLVSLVPVSVHGQSSSITGQVMDAQGAMVPNAEVRIEEQAQGIARTLRTNDSGGYIAPYLNPGTYRIYVQAPGFSTVVSDPFALSVGQTLAFSVRLRAGAVSENVTVTATESLLQSDTTVVGGSVERELIEDLPGRSLITLVSTSPSIAQLGSNGFGSDTLTPFEPGNRGGVANNLSIGGYRHTGNYYMLDGVSNTDWSINTYVVQPAVESLGELRVQTSTNSAAFGQVPGGTVNTVSRSGTNQYHGLAYDYLSNSVLNARPYNFSSTPQPKPPLHSNEFGGALGGPVRIPLLYKGENRTFFYVHYEGLRSPSSSQAVSNIPTAKARTGDLSDYGIPIYDPVNLDAAGDRIAFPGAVIPQSRLDQAALRMLSFVPTPSLPGTIANLVTQIHTPTVNDQLNLSLSHQISDRDTVTGTYHLDDESSSQDGAINPTVDGKNTIVRAQLAAIGETHTFSSRLINSAKLGFNRIVGTLGLYEAGKTDIVGELGMQGINEDPENWGFPSVTVSGASVITDDQTRPTSQRDNLYQFIDDATMTLGAHTLQWGFEFRRSQFNFRQANPARGTFVYTGALTAGPDPIGPASGTGLGLADLLLGLPLNVSRTIGVPQAYLRANYLAGYVGDAFRARRDLTLLVGVRYDYFAPPTDRYDNYFNLDFAPLPAPPVLVQEGTGAAHNLPSRLLESNPHNLSPRIGVAWQAAPRTVIRSAYGIYSIQEVGALYYGLVSNGITTQAASSSLAMPSLSTADAFGSAAASGPASYHYIRPDSVTPYVQEWNLGVQRQLTSSMMAEVLYAASRGTHLFRYRSFNSPFQIETGADLPPRPGILQQERTWPSLGPIAEAETTANSMYNSLQVRLNQRLRHGISLLNSFTWGKTMDDSSDAFEDTNDAAQDERDLRAEWAPANFDIRRRFSSAVLMESPFGTGRPLLGRGILGYLAGPWHLSSVFSAQDGYPQSVVNYGSLGTIGTWQRPNLVPGQPLRLSSSQRRALGLPQRIYYNPLAISSPGTYGLGDAPRDSHPTPGVVDLDLSLARDFRMPWEGHELLFRTDFGNALNIVNFGIPDPTFTDPNFGQLLTTGGMRVITLSLKYRF